MKTRLLLPVAGLLSLFVLTGCSVSFQGSGSGQTNTAVDGGVYRSDNKGANWLQKSFLPSISGKPTSFGSVDGSMLAFDPTDAKTIYFGTVGEGLLSSYDQGETWQRSAALGRVTVRGLAVDPEFRCTIYAAVDNKIMKTVDCGRAWTQLYYDNDPAVKINAILIDAKAGNAIYIGTSRGDVLKSLDRGESWQAVGRFKDKVAEVKVSPFDSKVIMVANERRGLQLSVDAGATWQSLDKNLADLGGAFNFKDVVFSGSTAGLVFVANGYGLLKSPDHGKTWSKISLLTPETGAIINSLAVNPKNDQEIYYVTNTTFYRSVDGGQNWTSKKLPSSRAGAVITINPEQPAMLFLTVRQLKN